jgi:hypothetical protein
MAGDYVFPAAIPGSVYRFAAAGYVPCDTLQNGEGYWVAYPGDDVAVIEGSPIASATLSLAPGNRWVLIGSLTDPLPAASIVTVPANAIVPGTVMTYDGTGYSPASVLVPGVGYWALVTGPCVLTLTQ